EQAYQEALETYRQLAADKPQTYLPDVAMTLNNLGILHRNRNEYPQAEHAYQEALETYRQLAADNPQTYLPDVADTLNNLGILHKNRNEYPQAEQAYQEALEIRRKLAADNPQTYLPNVAKTLVNWAELNQKQEDRISIEQAKEALQILIPFVEWMPLAQRITQVALKILKDWNIPPKTFLQQHDLPLSLLKFVEGLEFSSPPTSTPKRRFLDRVLSLFRKN
ncbi:MAG: tetratricopeptide repeat protein, partial [Bacteroidota bacterium]